MEVLVKGAQLTYPLPTMRSFCHDLVETYSHYVYPPWVDPYPTVLNLYSIQAISSDTLLILLTLLLLYKGRGS